MQPSGVPNGSSAPLGSVGIGIVGVGNMGGALAQRLGGLGWAPWVHDIDASKVDAVLHFGAVAPVDIEYCAIHSIATIICVVDAQQTRDVLFGNQGLSAHLQPGHVVILCPTIAPHDVEAIAAQLAAQGVDTIDAPMSGGPARARDGTMSLLVAGSDAAVARCEPLLQALSNQVFRISARPGDGARTKLVNNLLAGINLVGAAEAMVLARHMGLDLGRTLDVISQSSGQSWIGTDRMRRAIQGDLAPRAHMTLLAKDTRLAQDAAQAVGFDGSLGPLVAKVFAAALDAGLADLDDAAMLQFLDRRPL